MALYRWGWRGLPLGVGALGLAPALGYGALSLATFAWSCSGRVGGRSMLVLIALGLAATLVALTPRRLPLPPRRPETVAHWLALGAAAVAVIALCVTAAAAPKLLRALPIGLYDAHAIWNAHAAFLSRAEVDPAGLFRDMRRGHPDYPLFLPGAVAGQWTLLGWEAASIPQVTSAAFFFATAIVIGAALASRHRPIAGCLATAVYLSTPNAVRWGFAQCADVPLSYLFALAAVGVVVADDADAPLPPVLSGFVLGLLAWTKNEGMLLAALVLCVSLALRIGTRGVGRADGERTVRFGIGALAPLLALVVFKLRWSPRSELPQYLGGGTERMADPGRWVTVAAAFFAELDPFRSWQRWGAAWAFAIAGCLWSAYVVRRSRDPARAALLLTLLGALAIDFAIYAIGPRDLAWQLRTSLDRLLLQLLPLALICAFEKPPMNTDDHR
jgi:hypothetical protein